MKSLITLLFLASVSAFGSDIQTRWLEIYAEGFSEAIDDAIDVFIMWVKNDCKTRSKEMVECLWIIYD